MQSSASRKIPPVKSLLDVQARMQHTPWPCERAVTRCPVCTRNVASANTSCGRGRWTLRVLPCGLTRAAWSDVQLARLRHVSSDDEVAIGAGAREVESEAEEEVERRPMDFSRAPVVMRRSRFRDGLHALCRGGDSVLCRGGGEARSQVRNGRRACGALRRVRYAQRRMRLPGGAPRDAGPDGPTCCVVCFRCLHVAREPFGVAIVSYARHGSNNNHDLVPNR